MKIFFRWLIAISAAVALVASVVILGAVCYLLAALAGGGDGSGSDASSEMLKAWSVAIGVWIIPALAFILMLLGSFNRLKGIMHSIGYWYSLVILILLAGLSFNMRYEQFHHVHFCKWIGLACIIMACVWGYAFRKKTASQ